MSDQQQTSGTEDYEYDLVHETDRISARAADSARATDQPAQQRTVTPDTGGDYGYDMAHDLP